MEESQALKIRQSYTVPLNDLRKFSTFGDSSTTKLEEVKAFYAFNVRSRPDCHDSDAIIFFTASDVAFGQGHNCRSANMLGFSKSHPHYRRDYVNSPCKIERLSFKGILQMSIGGLIGAAVSDCGSLFWWGICYDVCAIMTPHTPRSSPRQYLRVSCGHQLMAALSFSGDVYIWGQLEYKSSRYFNGERLAMNSAITHIACGVQHVAMIDADGYAYTWGKGDNGQRGLTDYTADDDFSTTMILREPCIDVKCGPLSTFYLTAKHELLACGSNVSNHLGHLSRSRDGNTATTLSKIAFIQTVVDFVVVWNEDYTATIAAKTVNCGLTEIYTWGAELSPFPERAHIDSFFDLFITLKTTPGLIFVTSTPETNCLSSRTMEKLSKLVSDALVYMYLRDRPELTKEAAQFLWECRNHHLTHMVNLIPHEENGKAFVLDKFITDLKFKPQIIPVADDVRRSDLDDLF